MSKGTTSTTASAGAAANLHGARARLNGAAAPRATAADPSSPR